MIDPRQIDAIASDIREKDQALFDELLGLSRQIEKAEFQAACLRSEAAILVKRAREVREGGAGRDRGCLINKTH